MCSSPDDHLAHKITMNTTDSYELYSMNLIANLMRVNVKFESDCCYRLYGKLHLHSPIITFSMDELYQISEEELC